MRHKVLALILSAIIAETAATAGNGKEPSSPLRFEGKITRHRDPSPDQQSLFSRDTNNLAGQVARAKQTQLSLTQGATPAQAMALEQLQASSKGRLAIHWDDSQGVPVFVQGIQSAGGTTQIAGARSDVQVRQNAMSFLQKNAPLLRIVDPASELREIDLTRDDLGYTHIRYQQAYQGVEVWGRDVRVHLDASGAVESFNGRYIPTPANQILTRPGIDERQAHRIALDRFGSAGTISEAQQVILPEADGALTLCWLVDVAGAIDQRMAYFVDAGTGRVVKEYNRVVFDGPVVGSGTDVKGVNRSLNLYQIGTQYLMIDASKAMFKPAQSQFPNDAKGVIYAFDARNGEQSIYQITSSSRTAWSVPPGVSALFTGGRVYDYFKTIHNRNAIDNQGGTMNVVVNFKTKYNNAFWNGQFMVFGNGDGSLFSDLTGSADVTAHELTHGITEWTAGLIYENQSGALNESFSDVFGTLFEFWHAGAAGNWLMGEDVYTPGTPGDALRSMSNPGGPEVPSNARQPSTMSQYVNLPNTEAGDNGGVHVNSGIPNRAFYLFATASGMTKEDAGKVYYRALTIYLTKNSQFVDCRLAVIKSAEDLFGGAGNAKAVAAAAAFDAVGISTGSATSVPPVDPPVQGTQYLAVIDVTDGKLYRWTIGTSNFTKLSSLPLASRPAASDNGQNIFYVDTQNNLHLVRSDGTNDQALSTSGGFNNIAVSRSGRYLAATTVFKEPNIYLFDLQNSAGDKVLRLYTPTYHQGETAASIRYPDRIDWTSDEKRIMYDAYNTTILAGGDTLGFWDLNTVRVSDASVSRLFPSQPRGIDIGNAVFASNTDNLIAFDRIDQDGQVQVLGVNLNSGDVGLITNNMASLGSPSFSVDDRKVFYHYIDQSTGKFQVWSVDLKADGITGSGNDIKLLDDGVYPLAFAVGARSTGVPSAENLPTGFALEQNYPNPFNPSTFIKYQLPVASNVRLVVYDLLGREVAVLVNERLSPGAYTIPFDGSGLASGTYVYRLSTDEFVESRRMVYLK